MDEINLIIILKDYTGVIVGSILLLIATSILPGRIRWYVLTAGLAVIAFRGFQIWNNKKRLKEADAKREELLKTLHDLESQRTEMTTELHTLNKELSEIKTQQNSLAKQASTLSATSSGLATEKSDLDTSLKQLDEKNQTLEEKDRELMARIQAREEAIKHYNEAKQVSKELENETTTTQ